jgi:hypothetical protein
MNPYYWPGQCVGRGHTGKGDCFGSTTLQAAAFSLPQSGLNAGLSG